MSEIQVLSRSVGTLCKKHAKLTYLFIWKIMLVSYCPLKICIPCRNVCLCFGLCNPPTASLPNCISVPRVASWRKTQRISSQSWKLHLFLLVSSIWQPACASSLRRRRGAGEKKPLQYFEFGLQYLVQPLGVNPTYSNFKVRANLQILGSQAFFT